MSFVDQIDTYANRIGLRWIDKKTAAILVTVFAATTFVTASGLTDPEKLPRALSFAALVSIPIWILWKLSCRPPRVPKGYLGVVIAISTEREAERQRLKTELLEHLIEYLEQRPTSIPFKIIDIPSYLVPDVTDIPSAEAMCRSCGGKLLIWGSVRTRKRKAKETLVIRLEGQAIHRETALTRSFALSTDMRTAIPKKTEINLEDELSGFETTSQGLATAAKYIVAISLAVSDEWAIAKSLLFELEQEIYPVAAKPRKGKRQTKDDPSSPLKPLVARRLIEVCFADYAQHIRIWSTDKRDSALLNHAEDLLEIYRSVVLRHSKEGPQYWIPKAFLEVTLRKNFGQAARLLNRCQVVAIADPTWRLSLAFVATLQGSFGQALDHYDAALTLNPSIDTIIDIEDFVQWWLKENEGPPTLHLLSAMLNAKGKNDPEMAYSDLLAFETGYGDDMPPELQTRLAILKAQTKKADTPSN